MSKTCSTCGQTYPDEFNTCTCRLCGGLIEPTTPALYALNPRIYYYDLLWQEWHSKYNAAPPYPLRDEDWYKTCAYFNGCSICGGPIDEKLLVIPPILGGKLYTYNVLPACETCAKKIRQSQRLNPLKSFYTIQGSHVDKVNKAFKYLESVMLQVTLEDFNFEEDSLEIIVTCTEQTSVKPFTGIYAVRRFTEVPIQILKKDTVYEANTQQEFTGITWRLLDE